MTLDAVRNRLIRACKPYAAGTHTGFGLKPWCRAHGVASTHASDFLSGKRNPGSDLLEALGLEWRVMRKASCDNSTDKHLSQDDLDRMTIDEIADAHSGTNRA